MKKNTKSSPAKKCACPFCDEMIMVSLAPFCSSCGITLNYCSVCNVAVAPDKDTCPNCGRPVTRKKGTNAKK